MLCLLKYHSHYHQIYYFTEKSSKDSNESQKIHEANREHQYTRDEKWSFLDSLIDTFNNNRINFVFGFVMSALFCYYYILNDPNSKIDLYKTMEKYEKPVTEPPSFDLPLGYSDAIRKKRKEHPELYEA